MFTLCGPDTEAISGRGAVGPKEGARAIPRQSEERRRAKQGSASSEPSTRPALLQVDVLGHETDELVELSEREVEVNGKKIKTSGGLPAARAGPGRHTQLGVLALFERTGRLCSSCCTAALSWSVALLTRWPTAGQTWSNRLLSFLCYHPSLLSGLSRGANMSASLARSAERRVKS